MIHTLVAATCIVILMWIGLAITIFLVVPQVQDHCAFVYNQINGLPKILEVAALVDVPPSPTLASADGVILKRNDVVFVWPTDTISHNPSTWRRTKNGWSRTDDLSHLPAGSLIQVLDGLRYAHSSFVVRSSESIIPLWQHYLLDDNAISSVYHQELKDRMFYLESAALESGTNIESPEGGTNIQIKQFP